MDKSGNFTEKIHEVVFPLFETCDLKNDFANNYVNLKILQPFYKTLDISVLAIGRKKAVNLVI